MFAVIYLIGAGAMWVLYLTLGAWLWSTIVCTLVWLYCARLHLRLGQRRIEYQRQYAELVRRMNWWMN